MDFRRINFVLFSPTGTTKKVAARLDEKWHYKATKEYDLTLPDEKEELSFEADDFVVF